MSAGAIGFLLGTVFGGTFGTIVVAVLVAGDDDRW